MFPTDLFAVLCVVGLCFYAIHKRSADKRTQVEVKKSKTVTKTVYLIPPEFLRHYPGAKELQVNGETIWVLDIANQTVGFAANGQVGYRYTKLGREEWEVWPDMDAFRDWLSKAPVKQVQVQQPKQQNQPANNGGNQQPQLKNGQVKIQLTEQQCIDAQSNPNDTWTTDEKDNKYALPHGWHWQKDGNGNADSWYPARNKNNRP